MSATGTTFKIANHEEAPVDFAREATGYVASSPIEIVPDHVQPPVVTPQFTTASTAQLSRSTIQIFQLAGLPTANPSSNGTVAPSVAPPSNTQKLPLKRIVSKPDIPDGTHLQTVFDKAHEGEDLPKKRCGCLPF